MPKGCDCPVCKGDGAFHRVRKNQEGDRKIVSIKCKDCGAMSGVMLIPVEAGAKYASRRCGKNGKRGSRMAMRLESENVRIILENMLNEIDYWAVDGKEAEKQLCYIAGMTDMANAVIKAIKELGGR